MVSGLRAVMSTSMSDGRPDAMASLNRDSNSAGLAARAACTPIDFARAGKSGVARSTPKFLPPNWRA